MLFFVTSGVCSAHPPTLAEISVSEIPVFEALNTVDLQLRAYQKAILLRKEPGEKQFTKVGFSKQKLQTARDFLYYDFEHRFYEYAENADFSEPGLSEVLKWTAAATAKYISLDKYFLTGVRHISGFLLLNHRMVTSPEIVPAEVAKKLALGMKQVLDQLFYRFRGRVEYIQNELPKRYEEIQMRLPSLEDCQKTEFETDLNDLIDLLIRYSITDILELFENLMAKKGVLGRIAGQKMESIAFFSSKFRSKPLSDADRAATANLLTRCVREIFLEGLKRR